MVVMMVGQKQIFYLLNLQPISIKFPAKSFVLIFIAGIDQGIDSAFALQKIQPGHTQFYYFHSIPPDSRKIAPPWESIAGRSPQRMQIRPAITPSYRVNSSSGAPADVTVTARKAWPAAKAIPDSRAARNRGKPRSVCR